MPNTEAQCSSCPLLACGAVRAQREDRTWESWADEGARPRGSPRADIDVDATQQRTWGSLHDSRAGRPWGPLSGMVGSAVCLRPEVAWAPGGNASRLSSLQRRGRYFWLGCRVNPELVSMSGFRPGGGSSTRPLSAPGCGWRHGCGQWAPTCKASLYLDV